MRSSDFVAVGVTYEWKGLRKVPIADLGLRKPRPAASCTWAYRVTGHNWSHSHGSAALEMQGESISIPLISGEFGWSIFSSDFDSIGYFLLAARAILWILYSRTQLPGSKRSDIFEPVTEV